MRTFDSADATTIFIFMKYLSRLGRNNLLQINRESPAALSDQTFPPGEYAIMRAESWQNLNFS